MATEKHESESCTTNQFGLKVQKLLIFRTSSAFPVISLYLNKQTRGACHYCSDQCRSDERCPEKYKGIAFSLFPKPKQRMEDCKAWVRACGWPHDQIWDQHTWSALGRLGGRAWTCLLPALTQNRCKENRTSLTTMVSFTAKTFHTEIHGWEHN